ncbi:extracellular solute-binding protein [Epibacterium sp. SM1979]|uniref:sn-glycerol-3-phosphate-binding periplasmic protein UgpB n=1 Tax=Tritonibacter litoralis TaxID=2662264 RepID=A0A843YG12_9RHOB|nr:extracellular solute-binding protein [Tritonibacter litoralis]MQQ08615.1 extracellular solute-binding protein [Tritonibacter litoralis]
MNLKSVLTASVFAFAGTAAFADKTEIEFWHAMGGRLGEVVNEIATDFNASQEDYTLVPVYKGNYEETLTAGIAAFRAGEQPDIIQVFDAGAATIIGAKGAVVAAQDLLTENGVAFDANDYISGVRNFYADSEGKMIGMPFNSSTPILYFNEDAMKKAGVSAPKTWEEFQSVTAPALKEAGYVPMAQSHLPWIFTENFMSRHNLPFASNDNGYGDGETKILVNNDAIKAHFTALKGWVDDGLFGYYGAGWGDNQKPFEQGEVAMWLGSSGSFGGLSKTVEFPFSATYLPYWDGVNAEPTNTFIGGAALFAMAGKSEEENKATAEFFKFLTSAETQYYWHKETGYVPITNAAYDLAKKDGHYDRAPAAEVGIKQLTLPAGENTKGYRMGFYVQVRDVMNREYGKILSGEASVEDAFQTIEDEANKLLARFAKTQG